MKVISVAVGFTHIFLIINAVCSHIIREPKCPPAEDIAPCSCDTDFIALECKNVSDVETLRSVFQNSNGYTYTKVNISSSSLPFLPYDLFENVTVQNLILRNCTLTDLFDLHPAGLDDIESILIENTQVSGQISMSWNLLEHFKKLRLLSVYSTLFRILDRTFSDYVTKDLHELTFYRTETRRIKPGVLVDFVNLNKIVMDGCQLTTITRDIFPRPFNVQVLHFNDNRISSIPDDLFIDMPNLQTLSLKNNLISLIPESSFDGNFGNILYVSLDGNPLKCDCNLQWISREKPGDLRGRCRSPKSLYLKEIQHLETSEYNC